MTAFKTAFVTFLFALCVSAQFAEDILQRKKPSAQEDPIGNFRLRVQGLFPLLSFVGKVSLLALRCFVWDFFASLPPHFLPCHQDFRVNLCLIGFFSHFTGTMSKGGKEFADVEGIYARSLLPEDETVLTRALFQISPMKQVETGDLGRGGKQSQPIIDMLSFEKKVRSFPDHLLFSPLSISPYAKNPLRTCILFSKKQFPSRHVAYLTIPGLPPNFRCPRPESPQAWPVPLHVGRSGSSINRRRIRTIARPQLQYSSALFCYSLTLPFSDHLQRANSSRARSPSSNLRAERNTNALKAFANREIRSNGFDPSLFIYFLAFLLILFFNGDRIYFTSNFLLTDFYSPNIIYLGKKRWAP